jgi:two-component system, OmpR family, sensor histidine kinase TctE
MSPAVRQHASGMTIRRRLLLILIGPLALLLVIGIALDYAAGIVPLRAAFDQALTNEAIAAAAQLRARSGGPIEFDLPQQAIEMLRADKYDTVYYLVLGPRDEFVAGDEGLPIAAPEHENPTFLDAQFRGNAIRGVSYRHATPAGVVTITVAETTNKRDQAWHRMLISIFLTDTLQFAAILLLIWVGVRLGLRPLIELRAQIDSRSAQELAPLDETRVPGEVRPLTRALNRLFATVQANAQGQQQFLANAAHQLRTPLAGLQTQLELLRHDTDAAAVRERLIGLLEGTRRLSHTANQLLALARAEPTATVAADFGDVDLRELAEEAVAKHFDRALRKHIDLGVEAVRVRVRGSAWLLREMLANLVDNALTYTPAEGRVTVRCGVMASAPAQSFVEVEDDGPGIPPDQRARVTARFYRPPGASGDGCGLGLAIVDEIVRGHHAILHIGGGANDRGTSVRVTFPSA